MYNRFYYVGNINTEISEYDINIQCTKQLLEIVCKAGLLLCKKHVSETVACHELVNLCELPANELATCRMSP